MATGVDQHSQAAAEPPASAPAARRRPRAGLALAGVVVLAALLRFPTLDVQSFWLDEVYTAGGVLQPSLGDTLAQVRITERTPPLYYALAWLWTRPFGVTEPGLRSLSALCGTLTVPVVYLIGREVVSRRVGLAAAALVATNPYLVHYSQEARAHALTVLLGAISLLFAVRYLRSSAARDAAVWGVASALMLATFYFGAFLVAPVAAWLLWRSERRAPVIASLVAIGAVGAALLPLALAQGSANSALAGSLPYIVVTLPARFAFGAHATSTGVLAALPFVAGGALVALALLWRRGRPGERRWAVELGVIGLTVIAVPFVLVLLGSESLSGAGTFKARNVIPALIPLLVVVALGVGTGRAGRAGPLALASICFASLGLVVAAWFVPEFQRTNWRAIGAEIPRTGKLLAVQDGGSGRSLGYYMPGKEREPEPGDRTRIVTVVRSLPVPGPLEPPPGFRVARVAPVDRWEVVELRADRELPVDVEVFERLENWPEEPNGLLVRGD